VKRNADHDAPFWTKYIDGKQPATVMDLAKCICDKINVEKYISQLRLIRKVILPRGHNLDRTILGSDMELEKLAESIRHACLKALLESYEDAGIQGLCAEGRWEVAIDALRRLDLTAVVHKFQQQS
jgi:hypothetical protein